MWNEFMFLVYLLFVFIEYSAYFQEISDWKKSDDILSVHEIVAAKRLFINHFVIPWNHGVPWAPWVIPENRWYSFSLYIYTYTYEYKLKFLRPGDGWSHLLWSEV